MNAESFPNCRERALRSVALGCLLVFVVSAAMIIVGDPFWNLWVIAFGFLVAVPVGVVAAALLIWSRWHSARATA